MKAAWPSGCDHRDRLAQDAAHRCGAVLAAFIYVNHETPQAGRDNADQAAALRVSTFEKSGRVVCRAFVMGCLSGQTRTKCAPRARSFSSAVCASTASRRLKRS